MPGRATALDSRKCLGHPSNEEAVAAAAVAEVKSGSDGHYRAQPRTQRQQEFGSGRMDGQQGEQRVVNNQGKASSCRGRRWLWAAKVNSELFDVVWSRLPVGQSELYHLHGDELEF